MLAAARQEALRKWFLLLASLAFYAFWNIGFAMLLMAVATLAFGVGLAVVSVAGKRARVGFMVLGIGGALALLGYFKYFNFAVLSLMNVGLFNLLGVEPPFSEAVI